MERRVCPQSGLRVPEPVARGLEGVRTLFGGTLCLVWLAAILLCPLPVWAYQEPGWEVFQQAQRHFSDGEYHEAYELFFELFLADPANSNLSFALGRAAFEMGDFEAAAMAFERVLILQPDSERVKLELGRCYFRLGSLSRSRQLFEEVLEADPPPAVRENIAHFLHAIRQQQRRHFLSARVAGGIDWDSNVYAAPSSAFVSVPRYDLTVDVGRPKGDHIYTSSFDLIHVYDPGEGGVSWKSAGNYFSGTYHDETDLTLSFTGLHTGAVLRTPGTTWELLGAYEHLMLDKQSYLGAYGLDLSASVSLTPRWELGGSLAFRRKGYFDAEGRDASDYRLRLGPSLTLGYGRVGFSVGREQEQARNDVYSFARSTAGATGELLLPLNMRLLAEGRFEYTAYEDHYPLFLARRTDRVRTWTAGLVVPLWRTGRFAWELGLRHTYVAAGSSIELYRYTKNVTSVSLALTY